MVSSMLSVVSSLRTSTSPDRKLEGGRWPWKSFMCYGAHSEAGSTTPHHPITAPNSSVLLSSVLSDPLSGDVLSPYLLQEGKKTTNNQGVVPLTAQRIIPTEVAVIYPIIYKCFQWKSAVTGSTKGSCPWSESSTENSSWLIQLP